jgi:ABC-type multidrug transport system ATPase subunit
MVLTTHQMDVAQSLSRRIGIMSAGKLVFCERVDTMVDLFRRQDYIARMRREDWERLSPALQSAELSFMLIDEERPDQISARFMLDSAQQIYGLMQHFAAADVELQDFHQEQPTLEEVFLHVTSEARR